MTEDFNTEEYKRMINEDEDPLKDYPGSDDGDTIDVEALEVLPGDNLELLKDKTINGLPLGAADTIRSGRDLIRKQTEEANKVSAAIGDLFNSLNSRYGFNIKWDPTSFSENLKYIMVAVDQKALELYISEGYSKVRVLLYQQFLSAITALAAKVLDPTYLMSNSLSFDDQMTTIEKLFGFIEQMNSIYDQVHIDNVDDKLKNLKENNEEDNSLSLSDPNVRKYLAAFRNAVLDSVKETKEIAPSQSNT